MDIFQALEMLEREGIANSVQMVRRWIRQGKIKAKLPSKKPDMKLIPIHWRNLLNKKRSDSRYTDN